MNEQLANAFTLPKHKDIWLKSALEVKRSVLLTSGRTKRNSFFQFFEAGSWQKLATLPTTLQPKLILIVEDSGLKATIRKTSKNKGGAMSDEPIA